MSDHLNTLVGWRGNMPPRRVTSCNDCGAVMGGHAYQTSFVEPPPMPLTPDQRASLERLLAAQQRHASHGPDPDDTAKRRASREPGCRHCGMPPNIHRIDCPHACLGGRASRVPRGVWSGG